MNQTTQQKIKTNHECRTLRVEDAATILGIGRSAAYSLVRKAAEDNSPFKVMRLGTALLISKKSFDEYLEAQGL